jgi:pSer/pThr/pTyr-binding forkhead associated (FHA) protein
MKDGKTRQVPAGRRDGYLASHTVSLVFASGPMAGTEVALDKPRLTLGRGNDSDVVVNDASVSHHHAALELGSNGFRVRDLGSTNGVHVNGARSALAELKHGDTLMLGSIQLKYVVESRSGGPKTHSIES